MAGGEGLEVQPPHHRRDTDGDHRSGRRPRPHEDLRRSHRPQGARHDQQLRRRRDALGHLAQLRGELQRLFLGQARRRSSPRPRTTSATALGTPAYAWGKYYDRFDLTKEPNEPNRFGWVVEIDPFDPNFVPKKRTALGRTKHEGAAGITNSDGRYVVYLGDDERFDYVYKFVTAGKVDPQNRAANFGLLDEGTLYVAKYNPDGTRHLDAAGPRPGAAHRGERLQEPGRRADRDPPRGRPPRRHQDGPARGHRGEPADATASTSC